MPTTKPIKPPMAAGAEPAPEPPAKLSKAAPPPLYDIGDWCGHPQYVCRACGRTFLDDELAVQQHTATEHQPIRPTGYVEVQTKGV
ncbi:MAG: hypothetical protein HY825_13585 [Acidobacteria bacterium]|nr:hypothetical protein [Acidobacteriota bacterium]